MTDEEVAYLLAEAWSEGYEAGIERGWELAEAFHMTRTEPQ